VWCNSPRILLEEAIYRDLILRYTVFFVSRGRVCTRILRARSEEVRNTSPNCGYVSRALRTTAVHITARCTIVTIVPRICAFPRIVVFISPAAGPHSCLYRFSKEQVSSKYKRTFTTPSAISSETLSYVAIKQYCKLISPSQGGRIPAY
jgi:hypothetical protein